MKILMRADTHVSIILPSHEYDEPKCTGTQVLAAFAVSMGSMIVGFSSAYTSPALITMHNSLLITDEQQSWIGSLLPLAALMGGCLGGPLIEYIGRRNTITSTALPFFIGWMLIANANGVEMVLAGRAVCGFCVGIGSLAFPVYLGETIQPEVRGVLGLMPTAVGNIGILLCYVAGTYLDWSALAFVGSALSIPFLGCMLAIPETPRWYTSRNKMDEAKKSLQWLRGKKTNIDKELRNVARSESQVNENDPTLSGLLDPSCLKPIAISLGLMLFQQLSGINAVVFYTVAIFKGAGSSIDGNLCTIILGLVNFVSTFLATIVIDRLGRKVLLYISSIFMLVNLYILGSFFYIRDVNKADTGSLGWLPLMCLIIYILGFSLGFGPVPWLMMGEILPAKVRGAAASIATGFNWTCTFVVTKTFHNIIDIAGLHGVFWLFGSICLVGLFFVIFFVPETSGQSLEEIESKMTGKEEVDKRRRTRRMSSVANIKPLPMGC